uniref:Uncharacterized protein n=1 Tax=Curvibacter symbiont subsp. Hydra magnipapillata TaxID=667019 RepID=C9Y659_CURXX|nr:hypothetical protein Csp_E34360 [Curvibacter putative symbiont of Hydra magnipapillata]
MKRFVIYCKSYSTDVKRVLRLTQSLEQFNVEDIEFIVSCPKNDRVLFAQYLRERKVTLIDDEEIILSNPAHSLAKFSSIPGHLAQQIIKSEFWRLGLAVNYLCLDSDCLFIRPFRQGEFISDNGTPYSVVDECRELLVPALAAGKQRVIDNFRTEAKSVQDVIERPGKYYNFGPNCPVWNRKVWESLDENFVKPRGTSLADLILAYPIEMRWYGEALLRYKAIDLLPSQPFFKMYAYAWQLKADRRLGIRESDLAEFYCGVTYQSAWEREMDWPSEGGHTMSRFGRRLRRALGRT